MAKHLVTRDAVFFGRIFKLGPLADGACPASVDLVSNTAQHPSLTRFKWIS
jgi:hypothetical protein